MCKCENQRKLLCFNSPHHRWNAFANANKLALFTATIYLIAVPHSISNNQQPTILPFMQSLRCGKINWTHFFHPEFCKLGLVRWFDGSMAKLTSHIVIIFIVTAQLVCTSLSIYLPVCISISFLSLSLSLSFAFFSKSQSTFLAFFHYFRPIYLFTWIHIVQCGQKVLRSDREWKSHSTYANESIAHIYRTWGTRTNFANKSRSEKTANTHIDTRQKVDWHREMSTSING